MHAATSRQIGLIFGKFYPLHCGHIYMIEEACSQVDELHIMLGCESIRDLKLFEESHMPKQPQVIDRLNWLQETFRHRPSIHIHVLDETGIEPYPNGWLDWSTRVKTILIEKRIIPTVIFTSESNDVDLHQRYFNCAVKLVDKNRDYINISATQIRQAPYQHWQYIAKVAQPFFVKRICILNDDRASNLAQQFANIYNTVFVNSRNNHYFDDKYDSYSHLWQKQDFIQFALSYGQRLNEASQNANRYLFSDLNFVKLQAYFEQKFGYQHLLLNELNRHYCFDITIDMQQFSKSIQKTNSFSTCMKMINEHLC
ncbi:MAG: multifunctional transcriptional regulator/nicotinamide-nucleotide adenylyltransferase/ribosylnicotinamide kinase NadR [Candidatus Schmidhempelia sp.]|nr:multifunctional transcriptional regulator/nicotinamide-nucleotide adenylyltransferase/ribosylnicotinamide kinase NadR [Candidatus Schmidhempelia sp.]